MVQLLGHVVRERRGVGDEPLAKQLIAVAGRGTAEHRPVRGPRVDRSHADPLHDLPVGVEEALRVDDEARQPVDERRGPERNGLLREHVGVDVGHPDQLRSQLVVVQHDAVTDRGRDVNAGMRHVDHDGQRSRPQDHEGRLGHVAPGSSGGRRVVVSRHVLMLRTSYPPQGHPRAGPFPTAGFMLRRPCPPRPIAGASRVRARRDR